MQADVRGIHTRVRIAPLISRILFRILLFQEHVCTYVRSCHRGGGCVTFEQCTSCRNSALPSLSLSLSLSPSRARIKHAVDISDAWISVCVSRAHLRALWCEHRVDVVENAVGRKYHRDFEYAYNLIEERPLSTRSFRSFETHPHFAYTATREKYSSEYKLNDIVLYLM